MKPYARRSLWGLACLLQTGVLSAHDIPNDVVVRALVKPEGQHLSVLVRAPLNAMRDVEFPLDGSGYLDLARAGDALRDAAGVWLADGLELYEEGVRLPSPRTIAVRVSLPSDKSFASWDQALAHVTSPPLSADTRLPWDQAEIDVLFEYAIRSDRARFSIRPSLARLGIRVTTVLQFLPPEGAPRVFEYAGDPGLVRLDPRWHQSALRFAAAGVGHILGGIDHLLFLLCLVIPFRRLRPLVLIVTAFTLAHSITLLAAASNVGPDRFWFPPLIETLIAASVVYMALENIAGAGSVRRRWTVALGFGLVHGFGFSFALRENLQFAGSHLLTALLSFNAGVELGQLAALALVVPALNLIFRRVIAERLGTIVVSALVAHTAWHWMIDRGTALSRFGWPAMDAVFLAAVLRWASVCAVAAGLIWVLSATLRPIFKNAQKQQHDTDIPAL